MSQAEIETVHLSSLPTVDLPMSLNEKLDQMRPLMDEMASEAPGPVRYQAAAHALFLEFLSTAPPRSFISSNVTCAGVGLSTNNGNTIYVLTPQVAYTPQNQPIYRVKSGIWDEQGRLSSPGRMNGPFGWSKDRDLIAAALASFAHNFVAMLLGFWQRAKLPQTEPWNLPNLVLAETRAPNQLVLPASYTYQLLRPAVRTRFVIETSSSTPVSLGFDWWDSGKGNVTRIDKVDVAAGDNRIILAGRVPMSGYLTINPIDAPKGLVIKSVNTIPRSL